jgi:hypothetical protein
MAACMNECVNSVGLSTSIANKTGTARNYFYRLYYAMNRYIPAIDAYIAKGHTRPRKYPTAIGP